MNRIIKRIKSSQNEEYLDAPHYLGMPLTEDLLYLCLDNYITIHFNNEPIEFLVKKTQEGFVLCYPNITTDWHPVYA